MIWLLMACTEPGPEPYAYPEPSERPALRGPGGPAVTWATEDLWSNCATLTGDPEEDSLHHNEVMPYRGHLVMPWSPEWGGGGVSLFEMDDPCDPVKVGEGASRFMRETHSMGFVHLPEGDPHAGDYVAVTGNLGVQIWDLTDETAPVELSYLELDGVFYPDSYSRVVLSVFWAYPWLYATGSDNGVYVVDATDPANPVFVSHYEWDPVLRAAGVFVIGDRMLVHSAENSRVALMDVGLPGELQPLPGGDFDIVDSEGETPEAYHANVAGDLALFARKEGGGGVMVMDWSDPSAPTYAGDFKSEGNGGYVFYDEGYAFVGESHFAAVYDLHDLSDIQPVGRGYLAGDLDTMTPYGNVAVLSVDDDAEDGVASAVMPWTEAPDTQGPQVLRLEPSERDQVPVSTCVGAAFNEMIEPSSVFGGSIQLLDDQGLAVPGWGSGNETIASFCPKEPLAPNTTYTLRVPADGITDLNDNPTTEMAETTFTTAGS
jgi:hypothetical protein